MADVQRIKPKRQALDDDLAVCRGVEFVRVLICAADQFGSGWNRKTGRVLDGNAQLAGTGLPESGGCQREKGNKSQDHRYCYIARGAVLFMVFLALLAQRKAMNKCAEMGISCIEGFSTLVGYLERRVFASVLEG
jgi:hypothetical protein